MKKLFISSLILVFSSWQADAAQVRFSHDEQRLNFVISDHEQNRVAVKNDRITKFVFSDPGKMDVSIDPEFGYVFVNYVGKGDVKNIPVTIMTEKGFTQDLTLHPEKVSAETIILKMKDDQERELTEHEAEMNRHIEAAVQKDETHVDLMTLMLRGETHPDFKIILDDETFVPSELPFHVLEKVFFFNPKGIESRLLKTYKGQKLEGVVYEVHNGSRAKIRMNEEVLSESLRVTLLSLEEYEIEPGQTIKIFGVRHVL